MNNDDEVVTAETIARFMEDPANREALERYVDSVGSHNRLASFLEAEAQRIALGMPPPGTTYH